MSFTDTTYDTRKRYLIKSDDKASKNREDYFVEMGMYDYWLLSMKFIGNNTPPQVEVTDINNAFTILQSIIAECGNTINIDFPDGVNTDHTLGVEVENETMRLIWYSVDKAYLGIDENGETNPFIELKQHIFGENLERQYGFTFERMLITPSYILSIFFYLIGYKVAEDL